jgi:hypothetical protein
MTDFDVLQQSLHFSLPEPGTPHFSEPQEGWGANILWGFMAHTTAKARGKPSSTTIWHVYA